MQVVGVCTDSHVTVRTMLMNSASLKVAILTLLKPSMIILSLKGIKFPIICDRDGDFSRAFGVLNINDIIMSLKGIKFPIICDRDGDFSRAFGVLKLSGGNFGAARAVI